MYIIGQRKIYEEKVKMLTDCRHSRNAKVYPPDAFRVRWNKGFWQERFNLCADVTIPHIFRKFEDEDSMFHVVENFRIAAGIHDGPHQGTPYGDGDLYKLLEAAVMVWNCRRDAGLLEKINGYIDLIGKAQQKDGYLSTKQIVGEREQNGVVRMGDIEDFEVYNFGHLFTAACVYSRITGSDRFLKIAENAAGYLEGMYRKAQQTGDVQTAVCPSHYMGLVELYRTTGKQKYLELAELALALRDQVKGGTYDNQDRLPLKQHDKIAGHGVRSTYLYAGAADVYAENGDEELKQMLDRVWKNCETQKVYVTGGCGALYLWVHPYGLFDGVDRVNQAFGYEYQLPNITAYNETCATLENIFWNYRMFLSDPKAKYFDVIERGMFNVTLASVSLDGDKYFYENMLRREDNLDYELRWPLTRSEELSCYCCPPNMARTIVQASEYAYLLSEDSVWTGLYGASEAELELEGGTSFRLVQETKYPWEGTFVFRFEEVKQNKPFYLQLRIPGWVKEGIVLAGGKKYALTRENANTYLEILVEDAKNMEISADFYMQPRLTVAHSKVEEDENHVAVEMGPLVYCMEFPDCADNLDDVLLPVSSVFEQKDINIKGHFIKGLETEGVVACKTHNNVDLLYQELEVEGYGRTKIRLIPYFAWDNRGFGKMRIWIPAFWGNINQLS